MEEINSEDMTFEVMLGTTTKGIKTVTAGKGTKKSRDGA